MGLALGPDVFVRQSEALRLRHDRRDRLSTMTVPVLYICGTDDRMCPPAWHRIWSSMTADAKLVEVAMCGHMLPLEAPDLLARILEHWLVEKEIR